MCGIVGYVGGRESQNILMEGLKKLEYRGYDSAGIATLYNGRINEIKCEGKLARLEEALTEAPLQGSIGIGHTRWATHGRPSDENAHPHTDCTHTIAVVHNGIVENFLSLREWLEERGHKFASETDTEVFAHLVEEYYSPGGVSLELAVQKALAKVKGSYAVGIISCREPDKIVAARKDNPLLIGIGKGENFLASDIPAFLSHTREALTLQDGELAIVTRDRVNLLDREGKEIRRASYQVLWDAAMAEKGGYKHFMLKEIFEQPKVIADTLAGHLDLAVGKIKMALESPGDSQLLLHPGQIERVFFTAAGTAYHSGMVGKYAIEELVRIPAEVELSSEFRYREVLLQPSTLVVAISQSGETADTLAALREAKRREAQVMAVTNMTGSSITREAPSLLTRAGLEIGVAATKTFVAQLVALSLFSLYLAQERGSLKKEEVGALIKELTLLPKKVDLTLKRAEQVKKVAKLFSHARDFLFLGRHILYPIALEGALKLKEISYIHAEGYAAGEMKHGPIALIDEEVPVVIVASRGRVYEKILSNIKEVKARDATVIAVVEESCHDMEQYADYILPVPDTHPLLMPILAIIPLQLLAYYIADRKGCDVDQPRNLAKSVTVE